MSWYRRMSINVSQLIMEIKKHPEAWDHASEEYKGSYTKRDVWPVIVMEMYPHWPQLPKAGKKMISNGRRKEKVEICDRLMKSLRTQSGSPPAKRRVPYADQLQFILTSRNLRRTEGNIRAQKPEAHEGNGLEHSLGEEVEDFPLCSTPYPPGSRPSSAMSSAMSEAGTASSCADASSSSAVEVASVSSDAAPASGAVSRSAGGVSRPTGMGAGSVCPVTLRRAAPKGKKIKASTSVVETLTS
ncbi:uncharacterized protein LOC143809970 [Ranitomeya variabilis]|uniref:uncharacterized protein LOC143809970 n=1 Tax=Ranitomeya variabilis TaxID=490064 RepID=UPI0040575689